ncbi:hypothetical protein Acor_17290 [Acrocarpospora corrugata]|uniref:Uncharacterized protein n=1 Tax=Acrocarpospora corrugata TaxID=35763 RepID=A0A5M3VSP7_9ACTN|nr:hypothetical protein [Acrocarpospora corrugata]GER99665.1 hypothetical protein Acor_17290 [Acrocarpospora corrugata]
MAEMPYTGGPLEHGTQAQYDEFIANGTGKAEAWREEPAPVPVEGVAA